MNEDKCFAGILILTFFAAISGFLSNHWLTLTLSAIFHVGIASLLYVQFKGKLHPIACLVGLIPFLGLIMSFLGSRIVR